METVLESATAQALSLSHGPDLRENPAALASLTTTLKRAAERSPGKGVRYLRADGTERVQLYPELVAEASRILAGLRAAGLKPGDKAIFQFQLNEDFVPAFWACVFGGFVPVPLSIPPGYDEPHNTLAKLENAWGMLGHPVVLASSALVPGLQNFARRQSLSGFRVEALDPLRAFSPATDWHVGQPDDLALLLLTSGSTGLPKAVQLNHRNILSRSAATAQFDGFSSEDVSLNWMPLDHVGGLVMYHIRDVHLACAQIQVPTELVLQNPLAWLDCMARHKVTITWAPNFAFGLINDQAEAIAKGRWDLSSLRFILNGGEAIVSKTARRFLELLAPHGLPATAMRPAWGMSETSSGVTSSHRFTLAATADTDPFVEVGPPLPGISLRIVDRQGNPVPEGRIGSLQISGLTITAGYYENPKLNAEVFTADGWFGTGDLGVLKEGRLTITGREKDVIIINGVNFYSHEIESVVEEVDGVEVSFTAACAIRLPGENTDRIAVFFCPSPKESGQLPALIKSIRSAVVKNEGVNPDYVIPVSKESIPKTTIGKIQRAQLKQQFERGDFAELVRKYSGQAGEPAATPEWFYRPAWRDSALPEATLAAGTSFLLLADASGLAAELARELGAAGHPCTLVEAGADFAQAGPASFRLSPGNPEHYQRLIAGLGRAPDVIVHAWTYGQDEAQPASVAELEATQTAGAGSLLGLIKALGRVDLGERVLRLLVVSSRTRAVQDADHISYAKTPILGLVRTIPQEVTWLDCHHVDLEPAGIKIDTRRILTELRGWNQAPESAWRGETRKIPCLEKAEPSAAPRELPFKTGGLYLISGGIGGIGQRFAGHLLQHFDARLLIIGRTPLPPRAEWKKILAAGGPAADRIRSCEALEVQGGEFEYVAADAGDLAAMQHALGQAEQKWGRPLDGVFHLAGVYEESLLENETVERLTAVLHPKASGAWVLNELARKRPGCLFINFSSLISFFGSLSTGAYAAANNFLDAFSHHQRQACGVRAYNLLWSSWAEIGMSRKSEGGEALRSRGYLSMTAEQGVASLLYALRHDQPQLLVGLDGANKNIRKYFRPEAIAAGDTPADAVDATYLAPRTEIEKQFAKIWQDILGVPRVGLKDNFFELGGRSLLAAKMFAQVNKTLGKNLPIPALFKSPTIEQLSLTFLEQPKSSSVKITVLRPAGARPPLFLIPEAGVEGNVFSELAGQLGPDQPCFGLQARALTAIPAPAQPVGVEETARLFVEEICALSPAGPCAIGGRGFGTVLAWETARQLTAKNRRVILLGLFDPPAAAFFARDEGGSATRYRFIKPAGSAGGGVFGRLFKKGAGDEAGVSKESRQARERYGDAVLSPATCPVAVFGLTGADEPWRSLATAGFSTQPTTETVTKLTALTS
ncbi:MAG TPA: AMP-binding protein [Opitutaceae bacterium]|jgi:acyl-CoA synthetase (AMP-forming)/AMP-acid ligase II/NAD(P)-dependent dehydrogenase (short-subunit alcohol dehydrogenase family)|nr:AMP-binding protein [Opitutaceae bacterium]